MMKRSAIRRILEMLLQRYREGMAAQPRDDLRTWRITIACGVVGLVALMAILVRIAKALNASGRLAWETPFLQRLGESGPFTLSTAVWWQTFGTDITLAILIILTTGIAIWMRRPLSAWSIVFAFLAVDPIVRVGWMLWDRSRPKVLYDGIAAPAFHSFPSGHTGKTLAVYGILTFMWIRASRSIVERIVAIVLLAAVAVVVPLGRLSMGVHWPTDIIAGWLIGFVWLCVLAFALRLERR